MSHILKDLEFLVELSDYVVFDNSHDWHFESELLKYLEYIDEIRLNAKVMNKFDIFDKFPNQNKLIIIQIDGDASFEGIKRILETSKKSIDKVKFEFETLIISMFGQFNDQALSLHKRVKDYLRKQKGFNYTSKATFIINVDGMPIDFSLLDKYIDLKEITDLTLNSFSGGNYEVPDIRRFTNVESIDFFVSNNDLDLSEFKRLKSLGINEIEDFTKLNNSMPKSLKDITFRNQGDINKVPIKIPSTVETLFIDNNLERDFTFRSIDLTESQLYNIMLSKSTVTVTETGNGDSDKVVEHLCGPLSPFQKIKGLDYLPKTVKFFTVDASKSESTESYEIEPTLLVNFLGVYTNIAVETEIGSLRPDLHSAKLITGRCTNHA
ncbi:hypothetical protein CANINC_004788 [Pichia inconspicua]|uniref:Uncharacterized protein n=1 Tax=Pichia inconspicua TaxID=52247 RepID=A0A4T0WV40_9ASCO|nr:hypothetical protein CANINC_004788 [[Candida] inconspicua]